MSLAFVRLAGFQSYWEAQEVRFDPTLTLLAGRNDVGKSSLLRGMRGLAERQVGARDDFAVTFAWQFPTAELLAFRPDLVADGYPADWLTTRDSHTVAVTFTRDNQDDIHPGNLVATAVHLVEIDIRASGQAGQTFGWEAGPLADSTVLVLECAYAVKVRAAMIAYLAPRRIQPGARSTTASSVLTPMGENLTEVVYHLQTNEPYGGFPRLVEFMQAAFPQILGVTARTEGQQAELHVIYRGAEDRLVPLSQCGTGIEQMLALGAAILTHPEPRVFLIDEPQAYLHPHAERSLEEFLREHAQHQYVIATHSAVLLGNHPLRQTRLVSMVDGQTRVVQPAGAEDVLDELGVTAADLWLAERMLWVEGPSEVEIIAALAPILGESEINSIRVRAMPGASRFVGKSARGRSDTFQFLRSVAEAIAPLPVSMLFLFDGDEKTPELRAAMEGESGGRARFLPVREIENLLLDAGAIHELIATRCSQVEIESPDAETVAAALAELLAMHDDAVLYPGGVTGDDVREEKVVGSEILTRLYQRFLLTEYRKVDDGAALGALVATRAPVRLGPLLEVLGEVAQA